MSSYTNYPSFLPLSYNNININILYFLYTPPSSLYTNLHQLFFYHFPIFQQFIYHVYLTTFNPVPIHPFLYLIHNEIYVTFPMTPLLRLLYTAPSSLYFHPNHVNLYHCLTFFPHHLPLKTNIPVFVQLSLENINICILYFSIFMSFFLSFLCFHINQRNLPLSAFT